MNAKEGRALVVTLRTRFEAHPERHPRLAWADVEGRLDGSPGALQVLWAMERTGGEPDAVAGLGEPGHVVFVDCCAESPAGRRSLCYDGDAREARKANRPEGSAVEQATEMGIELLDERAYEVLQTLGEFDLKTSSWVHTPPEIRVLGGALFCDRRYGRVFTYHNGAQSYYAARGFRGMLKV